jgi:hypothetical protein
MTIALCFLTYSDLENPQIWYRYLKNHLNDVNIYIHSKYPLKHPFFKQYRCRKIVPTRRKEDISIVQATLSMLAEAYRNENNTHFLFICQSSIPLVPFEKLKDAIYGSEKSMIKQFIGNCVFRYYRLNSGFKTVYPFKSFVKQHPNMMLIRKHVQLFLKTKYYLNHFKDITCPDEHYFINILKLHGIDNEVDDRQITFCNYMLGRTQGLEHRELSLQNMLKIISMGFLFIRKISPKTNLNIFYHKYIYGQLANSK